MLWRCCFSRNLKVAFVWIKTRIRVKLSCVTWGWEQRVNNSAWNEIHTCMFLSLCSAALLYLSHSSIPLRRKAFTTKLSPETKQPHQRVWGSNRRIDSLFFFFYNQRSLEIRPYLRDSLCAYTLRVGQEQTCRTHKHHCAWVTQPKHRIVVSVSAYFRASCSLLTMLWLKFAHSQVPLPWIDKVLQNHCLGMVTLCLFSVKKSPT